MKMFDEIAYINRVKTAIFDAEQNKTISLSLSKQNITNGLKICGQILYKIRLLEKVESSMLSERAEIIGNIIVELVTEMIHDFHLKEELLLVKEFITHEGINTTISKILSSTYYTDN